MAGDAANPFVALALIPAEIAIIYEYMRYVYVAVLAVRSCSCSCSCSCLLSVWCTVADERYYIQAYTWDWLVSLSREFMMVKKDGFSFTIAIYFASRCVILITCIVHNG
jgi:hypothetical protein